MGTTRTGTVLSITNPNPSFQGQLTQDIDSSGPPLDIKDKTFPGTFQVGDRVTYDFDDGDIPTASNLAALLPGEVISTPVTGNKSIGAGESLTIVGTTLTGRITNSGGEVFLNDATVTGKVTVDEGGSIVSTGTTFEGKVILDDIDVGDFRGGNNFGNNVNATNANSLTVNGGNNFGGANLNVDSAGQANVGGNNFGGGNLSVDNSGTVNAANNDFSGSAGNARIEMCSDVTFVNNSGLNNIRVVGATTAIIDDNTCEGSIRAFNVTNCSVSGNTLNNADTSKNTRILATECAVVNMNNNNLNDAVGKAVDCVSVTMSNNTLNHTSATKRQRLRVQSDVANANVNISGNDMSNQNIRFLDEDVDVVGFVPTANVTFSGNMNVGRGRIDGANKATISNDTTVLNAAGDNNVNLRIHKSNTATITKSNCAGNIRLTENGTANATNNTVALNMVVRDNENVSVTGNTITGDLNITGTTGTCDESGNTSANSGTCES